MTRRSIFLLPFAVPDTPINRVSHAGNAVNRAFVEWVKEWNAMLREPGTLSIGEARAFEELEKAFKSLRSKRTSWLRGF